MTDIIDRSGCPARGKHGTASARQSRGCTCADAKAARARVDKRRRCGLQPAGYVLAVGTARRLQALAALGWPAVALAEQMGGCTRQHITWLRNEPGGRVSRRNATRVKHLYDALQGTPGPSSRARNQAARAGWAAPLAWHDIDIDDPKARPVRYGPRDNLPDEVLIARVIAQTAPLDALRPRHRTLVVQTLTQRGYSIRQIAEWLDAPERYIQRYRARARQTVPAPAAHGEQTEGLVA